MDWSICLCGSIGAKVDGGWQQVVVAVMLEVGRMVLQLWLGHSRALGR